MKKYVIFAALTLMAVLFMFGCGAAPETSAPSETDDVSAPVEAATPAVEVDAPSVYFPKYDDGVAVVYMNDNGGTAMLFLPAIGRTHSDSNTMDFIKPVKNLEQAEEAVYTLPENFKSLNAEGVLVWQEVAYAVVRDGEAQKLIELGKDGPEQLDWHEFYNEAYNLTLKNAA